MMTLNSEDSLLRNLARYQYLRNRHLTPTQDADDLFQDAWIQLNHSEINLDGGQDEVPQNQKLQKAVRRATDRAFGKLRKRCSRGNPSETSMQMEPADCVPDPDLVIDLRNLIQSLPLEERLVMELIRRGYDGTEIATLMKLSPQAVTRRKQKAVEKLRRRLDA
ncbi:MAG: sigma-70 family RNA polymerase sigma factor [Fuerstiella sp.]